MTGKRRSAPAAEFSCNAAAIPMAGAPWLPSNRGGRQLRSRANRKRRGFVLGLGSVAALVGFAATPTLADGKRVALVIGNSAYATQQDRHQSSL
jgi:hypothetical protein